MATDKECKEKGKVLNKKTNRCVSHERAVQLKIIKEANEKIKAKAVKKSAKAAAKSPKAVKATKTKSSKSTKSSTKTKPSKSSNNVAKKVTPVSKTSSSSSSSSTTPLVKHTPSTREEFVSSVLPLLQTTPVKLYLTNKTKDEILLRFDQRSKTFIATLFPEGKVKDKVKYEFKDIKSAAAWLTKSPFTRSIMVDSVYNDKTAKLVIWQKRLDS